MNELALLYALIRRFEGCKLMPYFCPAGILTCGWGSTGAGVVMGQAWTQAYADQRMQADALRFAKQTLALCPSLRGAPLCAIADFAYNLGVGRLRTSTLRKRIIAGDMQGAVVELLKWNRGGGKILAGLNRRRHAEVQLLAA